MESYIKNRKCLKCRGKDDIEWGRCDKCYTMVCQNCLKYGKCFECNIQKKNNIKNADLLILMEEGRLYSYSQ